MTRRAVCVLLLVCGLLNQAVAVLGRAHAEPPLPGHDPRPHVHTRTAPADHETEPAPDHDDDSVYAASADAVVGRSDGEAPDAPALPTPLSRAFVPAHPTPPLARFGEHPPPRAACPLYVRHLTLLI